MTFLTLSLLLALQSADLPTLEHELGSDQFLQAASVDALVQDPRTGRLASCASGGEVVLWDPVTGARQASIELEIQRAVAMAFLFEARLVVGGPDDHLHLLAAPPSGGLVLQDPFEAGFGDLVDLGGGVSAAPDGQLLAIWQVSGAGGGVTLADPSKPAQEAGARRFLELDGFRADAVAWSPDGHQLAVMATNASKVIGRAGTRDTDSSRVVVFDVQSGAPLVHIVSKDDLLQDLAFGPADGEGGGLLVAGGAAGLHLWDLAEGRELSRFGELGSVMQLEVSKDGAELVATGPDGVVEGWHLSLDTAPERRFTHTLRRSVGPLALDQAGHLLAGQGRRVRRWRLDDWSLEPNVVGHSGNLVALDARADRLVSLGMEGSLVLWELASGTGQGLETAHAGLVFDVGLSPDGTCLVTAGQDGTLRVSSLDPGPDFGTERFQIRSRTAAGFTAAAFSPAGDQLAGVSADGVLWIVDAKSGALLRTFEGLLGLNFRLAYSDDGARLAVGGSNVRVWDTSSWEILTLADALKSPVTALAFAPDGKSLGVGLARKTVVRLEISSGALVATSAPLPSRVGGLAFTKFGLAVTSVSLGGTRLLGPDLSDAGLLGSPGGIDVSALVGGAGRLFAGTTAGRIQVWK